MSILSSDLNFQLGRAQVVRHESVLGYNAAVGVTYEHVWPASTAYTFPSAAAQLRIRAGGNAADSAIGAGARRIRIDGVDASGEPISESLVTAGANASAPTTQSFLRVNGMHVEACGTYHGTNVGSISVETVGGVLLGLIDTGAGQSQAARYSVPRGWSAYLTDIHVYVESNRTIDVQLLSCEGYTTVSAPFPAMRVRETYAGVGVPVDIEYHLTPRRFEELTDIIVLARAATAAIVSVNLNLLLLDGP